jgi:hypothetical protein
MAVAAQGHIRRAAAAALGCEQVRSFDYKWLRGVPREQYTGAHVDWVYMGHGTPQLLTCWVPVGDIPIEMGTLAVCEGSHRLASFEPLRSTCVGVHPPRHTL